MDTEFFEKSIIDRRSLLAGLGGCMLSPAGLMAQTRMPLHQWVAERARALTQGQDRTLRLLLPIGSAGNVRPVIDVFRNMTGVQVTVIEAPTDDVNTELTLDALSGSQKYDLALPATFGIPDLVDVGAIRPISDYVSRYEPADFRKGILFATGDTFDGNSYGFQADGDAYVMFYNRSMLENPDEQTRYQDTYGVALDIPRTWEELDRQMAFFNRPEKGQWGGLLFRTPGYLAWEWWVRVHAKGIWPFSSDMQPQIASAQGIAALEEMINATRHLCPEVKYLGLFENWERFSRGDIYCNIGWGGSQKYFMQEDSPIRGNLLYGQTPGGMINGELLQTPYFNWGWTYVVCRNTLQAELAYLFALFASSPDMSTLAVQQRDGFFDPYRPEHYSDPAINAAYSAEFLEVQRASLVSAIPDLYLRDQGEYFRVLGLWLHRALNGQVSPAEALERTAQQWELVTNGADRQEQSARWQQLKQKYPTDLQARLQDV